MKGLVEAKCRYGYCATHGDYIVMGIGVAFSRHLSLLFAERMAEEEKSDGTQDGEAVRPLGHC